MAREGGWREAIEVGKLNFEKVKNELGYKAVHREVIESGGTYELREQTETYGSNFRSQSEMLSSGNIRFWNEDSELLQLSLVRHRSSETCDEAKPRQIAINLN